MSSSILKGFDNIFEASLNNEIQDNLIEFFDWGLLEKGNYFNVTLNETSHDNIDYSRLRLSSNTNFPSGQAWEGFRRNWIWQSGINVPSGMPEPLVGNNNEIPGISGLYINDNFIQSNATGEYAHHIDYFNGRVIFETPIPITTKLQVEYSYKYINILYANSLPWLREVQYRSNFINEKNFILPPESSIQLPAIAIELVPRRSFKGYQLGGGQMIYTDVIFHCLAEDDFTRNQLIDIISMQNDKNIQLFNINSIISNNKSPLNHNGYPNSGALRYPDLLNNFPGSTLRLYNTTTQEVDNINTNFYAGIVRMTCEFIKNNI